MIVLVAKGKTNKEPAAALTLSEMTIKSYLDKIFRKRRIRRSAQAAIHSMRPYRQGHSALLIAIP